MNILIIGIISAIIVYLGIMYIVLTQQTKNDRWYACLVVIVLLIVNIPIIYFIKLPVSLIQTNVEPIPI